MSWFSELADKAENLLNKIDQNAAAVLQETEKKIQSNFSNEPNKTIQETKSFDSPVVSLSKTELNDESKQNILKGKSIKRSFNKSNEAVETAAKKDYGLKVSPSLRQSRSAGNFTTIAETDNQDKNNFSSMKDEPVLLDLENDVVEDCSNVSDHVFHLSDDGNTSVASNNTDHFANMENELLRNEISVVNNEVSLLIAKAKNAEKVAEDKGTRLYQMEKAYALVLKENESLQEKIFEIEKKYHGTLSGGFDSSESEESLRLLENEKQNLLDTIKRLELSEMSNISIKSELESDLKDSESKRKELEEKLERAKSEASVLESEWKNYKIRANNTLLMKEKIIEELGGSGSENVADDLVITLNTQINQLKLERADLAAESARYQAESEKKSKEIEQLETRTMGTERQLSVLREAFRQEKAAKEIAEHTVNSLSKELKSMQHETAKQISSLRSKLRESQPRESDHHQLRCSNPGPSTLNLSETVEDRLRLLTQAMVAKQAALESVTSDRNALRLQLEKTENKYRSDLISMKNNQPRIIHVNDTDDDYSALLGDSCAIYIYTRDSLTFSKRDVDYRRLPLQGSAYVVRQLTYSGHCRRPRPVCLNKTAKKAICIVLCVLCTVLLKM